MSNDFNFTLPGLERPKSSRPQRIAEAIKMELSTLLIHRVSDPRLAEVNISRVVPSPDLKRAKVYFILPAGSDSRPVLKGMRKAKGFFRSHLAKALNMRYTPDLVFYYDSQNDKIEHIEALLQEINQENKADQGPDNE